MSCLRLVLRYPYIFLGAIFAAAVIILVLNCFLAGFPDFENPTLGFETRGTVISNRIRTYGLLLENTFSEPTFLDSASSYAHLQSIDQVGLNQVNLARPRRESVQDDYEERDYEDGFFCDYPNSAYAKMVFTSWNGKEDLFTARNIKSMCELEDSIIRDSDEFDDICIRSMKRKDCCRSWSLGNYVALLNNKSSCHEISDANVQYVLKLVENCRPYFQNYSSIKHCWNMKNVADKRCSVIPRSCQKRQTIYLLLYFLTDMNFFSDNLLPRVSYATTFLPVAAGVVAKKLYYQMEQKQLSDGITNVVAVDFGIKQQMFDECLVRDMFWFGIGLTSVIILTWLYTGSLFIMLMTVILIFMSTEISFFLYSVVFQIDFFPFMNLLVVIILIGIGVDSVFIYCSIWNSGKFQKNSLTLEKLMTNTLRHASLSVAVTSLTTAAAFYSSYVTNVLILRNFAVFAGTAILVNFALTVIWMPLVLVVQEKWCTGCFSRFGVNSYALTETGIRFYVCGSLSRSYVTVAACFSRFFSDLLPGIIVKLRYLWLIVLGALGIGGAVIIFIHPKLHLPSTNEFPLFYQEHLFEVYDLKVKRLFLFEKEFYSSFLMMPISIVWGVYPTDTANALNPHDRGTLVYDKYFDVSTPEAQMFLLKFCRRLRAAEYYFSEPGPQLTNCFIEHFQQFMKRSCKSIDGTSLQPCCASSFPVSKEIFEFCVKQFIPTLSNSAILYSSNQNAGLRFTDNRERPVALVVEFDSKQQFTLNYNQMKEFFAYMDDFVSNELKKAPAELKNGWFVSHLPFFDLQLSIAEGTPRAIGVSISVAFAVAFCMTLNVLITLYSMLSIAGAIFVTVAMLVLLGWELNILESVTISVAVGLSIDYSLHYGMAYRLSTEWDRSERIFNIVKNIGSPIAMAAATTFLCGASLMPSVILAYRQLGTFLMIVIFVSWIYATFFFQSLLLVIGPKGNFGQLRWPTFAFLKRSKDQGHVDKTVYATSDSGPSSSSTAVHANSFETSELEQLTERLPLPSTADDTSSTDTNSRNERKETAQLS